LDVEESPRTPRLGGSSVDVNQSGPSTCSERTIINCSRTYRAVNSRERKRKGGYIRSSFSSMYSNISVGSSWFLSY
jgi:hypothetical protein